MDLLNLNYLLIIFMMILILIYKFNEYFLMMLISMEFLVLLNLLILFEYQHIYFNDWLFLYYMVFTVSESVIGFSLMINIVYLYGNQNLSLLNLKN